MAPGTVAAEERSGHLVVKQWSIAVALQTEYALFVALEQKGIGRAMRSVARRAPLDATGQVLKGKGTPFFRVTPGTGLMLHTAQGNPARTAVWSVAVGA